MFTTCPGPSVPSPLVYPNIKMFLLLCGNYFHSEGLVTVDIQWSGCKKCTDLHKELKIWSVFNIVLFVIPAFKLQITCFVLVVLVSFKCFLVNLWRDLSNKMKRRPWLHKGNKSVHFTKFWQTWKTKKLGVRTKLFCLSWLDGLQFLWSWTASETNEWTLIEFWNTFSLKKKNIDLLEQNDFFFCQ